MKRIIAIVAALALLLALAGCSANNGTKETTAPASASTAQADETKTDTPEKASGSKALVVYFSRTGEQYGVGVIEKGNTAIVADMIVEQTGADSFEILPKTDNYPTTYKELTDVAKDEQNQNARPAIKDTVQNLGRSADDLLHLPRELRLFRKDHRSFLYARGLRQRGYAKQDTVRRQERDRQRGVGDHRYRYTEGSRQRQNGGDRVAQRLEVNGAAQPHLSKE